MFKKVCVIGEGITSLIITKMLLDLDLEIDLISDNYFKYKTYKNRTLAISQNNVRYLENLNILKISKNYPWNIDEINLYNAKNFYKINKIFTFKNKKKPLFFMFKNDDLFMTLKKKLNKNLSLKIYPKKNAKSILEQTISKKNKIQPKNYSLIINCDSHNTISRKYFSKKIKKNYSATAVTLIINHKKIYNKIASQFFTKEGPIAFLPLSNKKTSIVWSINKKYLFNDKSKNDFYFKKKIKDIAKVILKNISFSSINYFDLHFSISREYYHQNILSFGEELHQIHPLAGQGFNMTIRDIRMLNRIIRKNINLGLDLNSSILEEFSKSSQSYNFLFAQGVNLTEKYISMNNDLLNKLSDQIIKKIDKNIFFKNFLTKVADLGINTFGH